MLTLMFHEVVQQHMQGPGIVKKFLNRLRIDRIMVMSLWPRFFAHAVHRRLKRRLDLHPQGVADSCQAEFWQK